MGLVSLRVPTWASARVLVQHADAEVWAFSSRGHFALSVRLPLSTLVASLNQQSGLCQQLQNLLQTGKRTSWGSSGSFVNASDSTQNTIQKGPKSDPFKQDVRGSVFLITVIPALCFVQVSCCLWLPTGSLELSLKANRSLEDDLLLLSVPFVHNEMGKKVFVYSAPFCTECVAE